MSAVDTLFRTKYLLAKGEVQCIRILLQTSVDFLHTRNLSGIPLRLERDWDKVAPFSRSLTLELVYHAMQTENNVAFFCFMRMLQINLPFCLIYISFVRVFPVAHSSLLNSMHIKKIDSVFV